MRIELQWAMIEDDRAAMACALCGADFQPEPVILRIDPYGYEMCETCLWWLSKRREAGGVVEDWPTWEQYRRALAEHPEVMFPDPGELERGEKAGRYWEFWELSVLDRVHIEPNEESLRELIRKADAFADCKTMLIDAVKAVGGPPERWNNIRKHVFPVLRAESARLEKEVKSYRKALEE